jgi:multiple sugar transport system substrate-binding protein
MSFRMIAVACTTALLAAFGLAGISSPAPAEEITVNFLNVMPDKVYVPAIAAFEKANPGIKIREQKVPFDQLNAQVQARISAGDSSIDIYSADPPRIPALVSRKLLADVSNAQDKALSACIAKAVDSASVNGKLYALPEFTSMLVLFYNKDLLEKAGITPPSGEPGQRLTWEQLLADARKAQQAGAKWGFCFEQVDRYYQLQPLFESSGAGPGLTGDKLLTPDVNSPKWVETTKWYGDLFSSGLSPRGVAPEQTAALFANGQIAYFIAGPWNFAGFEQTENLHFGIAPHPYFSSGKPITPTDGWAIGINPHGKHGAEALKFAMFLTLDDSGASMTSAHFPQPPANKVALQNHIEAETKAGGEATAPYGDILNYELTNTAVSRPRTVGYVAFEEIMNKTFSDVRNGADAKQALDGAQKELETTFARLK